MGTNDRQSGDDLAVDAAQRVRRTILIGEVAVRVVKRAAALKRAKYLKDEWCG